MSLERSIFDFHLFIPFPALCSEGRQLFAPWMANVCRDFATLFSITLSFVPLYACACVHMYMTPPCTFKYPVHISIYNYVFTYILVCSEQGRLMSHSHQGCRCCNYHYSLSVSSSSSNSIGHIHHDLDILRVSEDRRVFATSSCFLHSHFGYH